MHMRIPSYTSLEYIHCSLGQWVPRVRTLISFIFSVTVSFDPTTYTVTEGVDGVANLMLVRSGDLTRTVVVTVTTAAGTATGMTHHCLLQYCNIYSTMIEKFSITMYMNSLFVAAFVWLYSK